MTTWLSEGIGVMGHCHPCVDAFRWRRVTPPNMQLESPGDTAGRENPSVRATTLAAGGTARTARLERFQICSMGKASGCGQPRFASYLRSSLNVEGSQGAPRKAFLNMNALASNFGRFCQPSRVFLNERLRFCDEVDL